MDPSELDFVKQNNNPWDVYSIFEFNYFCCPECDARSQNKQDFVNHATSNHPHVSPYHLTNLHKML